MLGTVPDYHLISRGCVGHVRITFPTKTVTSRVEQFGETIVGSWLY